MFLHIPSPTVIHTLLGQSISGPPSDMTSIVLHLWMLTERIDELQFPIHPYVRDQLPVPCLLPYKVKIRYHHVIVEHAKPEATLPLFSLVTYIKDVTHDDTWLA